MINTAHYAPASGSQARRAWDRLTEEGRAIAAAWHDNAGDAADRLHASPERSLILAALGYDHRPVIAGLT